MGLPTGPIFHERPPFVVQVAWGQGFLQRESGMKRLRSEASQAPVLPLEAPLFLLAGSGVYIYTCQKGTLDLLSIFFPPPHLVV